jgi:hypothetical protein
MNKLSFFSVLLIWCSGADIELLRTCAKSVVMKYAQLGFLILIPSLFAFISASYFLSTVFERHQSSQLIAVGGGVFWAIVVFSLDRFLVMTVKKSKSVLKDLFSVSILSRMALAVLIGYVVAHPLVLKLFEPNLQEILMERNAAKEETIRKQWDEKIKLSETELTGLTERMEKLAKAVNNAQACVEDPELQRLIKLKQDEISTTEQDYADEIAGKANSHTGRGGEGPVARAIKESVVRQRGELTGLQSRLATTLQDCKAHQVVAQKSIDEDNALRSTQRQALAAQLDDKRNALDRLRAQKDEYLVRFNGGTAHDFLTLSNTLDELSQKNPNVLFWERLLTALLCAVDLLAMIIKMTCQQDEYDKKKQTDEFYRVHEIELQLKAHQESVELHLANALAMQQNEVERTKLQLQAAHTQQKLKDINIGLSKLAETQNEFQEVMSLLKVLGKIPSNSREYETILEEYSQVVSAASMRLIAEASQ